MVMTNAITWQKVPSHEDAAAHWADADDHWTQVAHWEIRGSTWSTGPQSTGPSLTGPLGCLTQSFPSLTGNSHKLYFRRSKTNKKLSSFNKIVQIVKRTEGDT